MTLVHGLMRVYCTDVDVNPVQVDRCYNTVTERSHRHNEKSDAVPVSIAEGRAVPEDPG